MGWESIDKPETVGFSSERLAAVRVWVSTLGYDRDDGRRRRTHAPHLRRRHAPQLSRLRPKERARRSSTAATSRTAPSRSERTLSDLKFTDVGGLLPIELDASVQHLLTARSVSITRPRTAATIWRMRRHADLRNPAHASSTTTGISMPPALSSSGSPGATSTRRSRPISARPLGMQGLRSLAAGRVGRSRRLAALPPT